MFGEDYGDLDDEEEEEEGTYHLACHVRMECTFKFRNYFAIWQAV